MGCSSSKSDASAPLRSASTASTGPPCRENSFYQKYILGRKLGQGSYGQVRAATSTSGEKVAVKVQRVKGDGRSREAWAALKNESLMWEKVSGNPNIVQFYDDFETRSPFTYYIVMEVCKCSVLDGLKSDSNVLTCLSRCFREMLLGLSHVHSRGVVHRDVKPDNFLLGGPDGQTTKLTDFGLSTELPKKGMLFDEAGSAPYMSPELLGKDGYREKTDVWSLGVTAYLMLYGQFPYMPAKLTNTTMKAMIRKGTPSPSFQPSDPDFRVQSNAAAFVKALLQRTPLKRCSADEALLHGFVPPIAAPPAPVAPVEAKPERHVKIALADVAPAPMDTIEQPLPSPEKPREKPNPASCPRPSGTIDRSAEPPPRVGADQRNALSAARALSRTGEFKTRPDPTVQRDLDELLQRLQVQYGTAAEDDAPKPRFSKRSFTSSLEVEHSDAFLLEESEETGFVKQQTPNTPLSHVPTPGRRRSSRQLLTRGWENRGTTWSVGDGPEDGSGDGLGVSPAKVRLLDDGDVARAVEDGSVFYV